MLRPSKHSHPDRTVISLALLLLKRLRKRRIEEYGDLLKYARNAVVGGQFLFLYSLSFLYLTGLIEYHPKTDSIEYVGPNVSL